MLTIKVQPPTWNPIRGKDALKLYKDDKPDQTSMLDNLVSSHTNRLSSVFSYLDERRHWTMKLLEACPSKQEALLL